MSLKYRNNHINVGKEDSPYYLEKPTEYVSLTDKIVSLMICIIALGLYCYFRRTEFFSLKSFVFDFVSVVLFLACIITITIHLIGNSLKLKLITLISFEEALLFSYIIYFITFFVLRSLIGFVNDNVIALYFILLILFLFLSSKFYMPVVTKKLGALLSKTVKKIIKVCFYLSALSIIILNDIFNKFNMSKVIFLIIMTIFTVTALYNSVNAYLIFKYYINKDKMDKY